MALMFLAMVVCGFCFGMGALVGYFHGLRHARRETQEGFPVLPVDPAGSEPPAGDEAGAAPRFPPIR